MTDGQQTQLWTPVSVVDSVMYDPRQGSVHAKQVAYRLYDGTISHIDIPASEFNAQVVQDRIHAAAIKHAQVMSLKGPHPDSDLNAPLPPVEDLMR